MFKIGKDCQIHPTARIEVEEGFLGDRSIVQEGAVIEGKRVEIGREAFLGPRAWIGGGSCYDPESCLSAGDWLHMGCDSHINIARRVTIGHEFGCGMGTRIFTHGAYLPADLGFPVQWGNVTIGDRVWMPNAWVNPNVTVGSNVVVGSMSLINHDLPSGCLAAGVPCRVIKENVYPRDLSGVELKELLIAICNYVQEMTKEPYHISPWGKILIVFGDRAIFDVPNRIISGFADEHTEVLKNQLRRNGIRFRFTAKDGYYMPWASV